MKKVLLILSCIGSFLLALSSSSSVLAEQHEGWSIGTGLMFSQLDDSSVASGIKADQAFDDDAIGFDLYTEYKLNDYVSPVVGYNFVKFDGELATGSGITVNANDLKASALYAGIKVRAHEFHGFELYGKGEIGFGFTSDVDYKVDATGTGGSSLSQPGLDGSTSLYYGIGLGIRKRFESNFELNLGYSFRGYGRMDGNRGGIIPTRDYDVETSSIEVSVGYHF